MRRTRVGLKYALSINTSLVSAVTPESRPPNTPAIHIGFSASQIMRSRSLSERSTPSRVVNFVPLGHVRTTIFSPVTLARSKQWSGWPIPLSMKFVMSTILLIGRWPMARRRLRSHSGDSFTSTLRIVTPEYLGHPSLSSTFISTAPSARSVAKDSTEGMLISGMADSGSFSAALRVKRAFRSRATP